MHLPCPTRYEQMSYNRCGRSGLKLPSISLGLYQNFTDANSPERCSAIVTHAFDRGITHFDLANNYGVPAGSAERIFGRILMDSLGAYRDEMIITTKAGYDMWPGPYGEWGSRKYLLASLDQSLGRLGLDYVDIFYSHRHDPHTPLEETMGALASAVHQGKALYVGLSNYEPDVASEAISLLRALGTPCLVHQVSYSILNRRIERDLLPLHEAQGVGTVIFQPLQRGLLSEAYLGELSQKLQDRVKAWGIPAGMRERLPALDALARARGQTLVQLALAWSLRDSRVCSALVGASSPEQLDGCLGALGQLSFTSEELALIERTPV